MQFYQAEAKVIRKGEFATKAAAEQFLRDDTAHELRKSYPGMTVSIGKVTQINAPKKKVEKAVKNGASKDLEKATKPKKDKAAPVAAAKTAKPAAKAKAPAKSQTKAKAPARKKAA